MRLQDIVEKQTRKVLNVTNQEFEELKHPSPSHLHDPSQFLDMRELVGFLHRFKEEQEEDPNKLLVVFPDYDTDGISSAAVLTASLSVFEINHRIYIPIMSEGYGLSAKSVKNMINNYETDGLKVSMILTADNGINAFEGIRYAKEVGIPVLVTDHHLGSDKLPPALALVNPNRDGDRYPFKGNAGATVAWKAMLAYAKTYAPDKTNLIQQLIIFAGMANVADVMPILDENRYMVKMAVEYLNELREYPYTEDMDYSLIMNSGYPQYDAVFHGIYDMVTLLQKDKDDARKERGKGPIALPDNEEIFGWYLSPLLNAPRRVHGSSIEGMVSLISTDVPLRHRAVLALIELNKEKSVLRNRVVEALDKDVFNNNEGTVVFANTRPGISGLIAGQIQNRTAMPTVVFSYDNPNDPSIIYQGSSHMTNQRISGSARSNPFYPLNKMMERINEMHPNLVAGGGHMAAAGMSIETKDLELFTQLFKIAAKDVYETVMEDGSVKSAVGNIVTVDLTSMGEINAQTPIMSGEEVLEESHALDKESFAEDILKTIDFKESLRPFGKDFDGSTQIRLRFNDLIYDMGWNPGFWKTFKFNIKGVEVLTFDTAWANQVKADLALGQTIEADVQLSLNEFRGNVTPQFIISPVNT